MVVFVLKIMKKYEEYRFSLNSMFVRTSKFVDTGLQISYLT